MKSQRNFIENKYNVGKKKAKTRVGGKGVGGGSNSVPGVPVWLVR